MSELNYPEVGLSEWKKLAKSGEAPDEVNLRKAYRTEAKAVDGAERAIDFVISTGSVDREGDTISPEGGDYSGYLKGGSGPVLFGHDHSQLPIAFTRNITPTATEIISRAEFPTKEELGIPESSPSLGETVFRMVKGGFGLNSASVGILPKEWSFNEDRKGPMGWPGVDFEAWELLEWSVVSVPANSEAIALRSAGIDPSPVWYWARHALDENDELSVVDRKKLELLVAKIGHPRGLEIFDMSTDEIESELSDQSEEKDEDAVESVDAELTVTDLEAVDDVDATEPKALTEDDVRRVIQEELKSAFQSEEEFDLATCVSDDELRDVVAEAIKDRADRASLRRLGTLAT